MDGHPLVQLDRIAKRVLGLDPRDENHFLPEVVIDAEKRGFVAGVDQTPHVLQRRLPNGRLGRRDVGEAVKFHAQMIFR